MAIYTGSCESQTAYGGSGESGSEEQDGNGLRKPETSELNGRASPTAIFNPYYTGRPRTPVNSSKHTSIDRQELIRKIKSRDSRPTSPELERPPSANGRKRKSPTPYLESGISPEPRPRTPQNCLDNHSIGMEIERPRSALHRGDFREREDTSSAFQRFGDGKREQPEPAFSTSPVVPWHPSFPSAAIRQHRQDQQRPPSPPGVPIQRPIHTRASSNTPLAASFVYKAPTSPLVQSSRPDTPEPSQRRSSRSPDKSRRHTFSPQSLQHFQSALEYPASARAFPQRQPPALRAERTFPYQAHQPRRSLGGTSLPQTPAPGSRRPSFSDSPLHHAPMVGSYEESILRGRMSTTPSKPLNFVAQIGVLGRGNCKSNLRCPPHVTVPFPAVFYSYNSDPRLTADQPSPYVGLVDLENNLPNVEPSPEKRRQRLEAVLSDEGSRASSRTREEGSASDVQARRRRRQKQKRRSGSPKAPPGGSYRIPQTGQLQIIIKNPNKTAVKFFLVPYDLSDMEPGQKTFIRQRSYSAGPVIDMPLSSRKNLGTDRPEAALSASDDPNERPMLRYLIHLHICCPSKGRYFLYKSVRIVFANRVPDGKEKLRNEIQLPEPRYSTYKPNRDNNMSSVAGSTTPKDGLARRQRAFEPTSPSASDDRPWPRSRHRTMAQSLPCTDHNNPHFALPLPPLPFHVNPLPPPSDSLPGSRQLGGPSDSMDLVFERSLESTHVSPRSAAVSSSLAAQQQQQQQQQARSGGGGDAHQPLTDTVRRRLDDPFNFERDHSRERGGPGGGGGGRSESLLSRRLRDLAMQGAYQANGHGQD